MQLLLEQIEDAARDFEKCTKLKSDFALANAQHCYAKYRLAILHQSPMQMQAAMQTLEECTKTFPTCAEAFALYAQVILSVLHKLW